MNIGLIVCSIITGAGLALQAAMNARLRTAVGQPLAAAVISFVVGGLVLLAGSLVGATGRIDLVHWRQAPWWAWIGGIFGAAYVATAIVAVPRIGAALLICCAVAGQVVLSLVLDSTGWLGVPRVPLSAWRLGGAVLIVAGVLTMQRR